MAEKMRLEIVTPYSRVVDMDVDEVTASGTLGDFTVLPGHAPFLTSLRIGELCYKVDGVDSCMALNWGYFEIREDRIVVLVETAERSEDIDMERAMAARDRAEESLKKLSAEDRSFKAQEAALMRALIRMQVAAKAARK